MFLANQHVQVRWTDLSPAEAAAQLAGMRVVDVREPHECASATGMIAGAINVPLAEIDLQAATWDRDQPLLLVCRSGARSARAAGALAGLGFTRLFNLYGGMLAWNERGLPVAHNA